MYASEPFPHFVLTITHYLYEVLPSQAGWTVSYPR